MRDYSNLGETTKRLLTEADELFDSGRYDEAAYIYIDAHSSNMDDLYLSVDTLLGEFKCEVYSDVQKQYFPSEQGRNQVAYIRDCFQINANDIEQRKNFYISQYGKDQEYFNYNEAKSEIEKLRSYYENSYKSYLERKKNLNAGCLTTIISCVSIFLLLVYIILWFIGNGSFAKKVAYLLEN